MKRVLVVGNSHAGALYLGWPSIAAKWSSQLDVSFFAAPGTFYHRMTVTEGSLFGALQNDVLTPEEVASLQTINGRIFVDLESFDEILLAGMNWAGVDDLAGLLAGFSIDGLYEPAEKPQRLTYAAAVDFLQGLIAAAPMNPIWTRLKRPKVTMMIRPMPVAAVRHVKKKRMLDNVWSDARIDTDRMRPLLDLHRQLAAAHYGKLGITLMDQPSQTMTKEGLTQEEFCRAAISLTGEAYKMFDPAHMNGDYGRICLDAYLNRLQPAPLDPINQEMR